MPDTSDSKADPSLELAKGAFRDSEAAPFALFRKKAFLFSRVLVWLPALLMLLPLGGLVLLSFSGSASGTEGVWDHLRETTLLRVSWNTVRLVFSVAVFSTLIGTVLAWLVTQFKFPGREFFSWVLALPLAIPGYVLAFVWVGSLDYSGGISTFLRNDFAFDLVAYLPIRSFGGVVLVLSLSLFPYVYILARNAFESLGPCTLEVARSLGTGLFKSFYKVLIPASAPWIVSGTSLVVMETLADFGTVSIFNFDTFTTAIYQSWFSLHSIQGAAQLAIVHLICVCAFLFLLSVMKRGERKFEERSLRGCDCKRIVLSKKKQGLLCGMFLLVFLVTIAFPIIQLALWSLDAQFSLIASHFWSSFGSSLALGAMTAVLLCIAVLGMNYAKRILKDKSISYAAALAKLGYAIPGTIIAVAVMLTMTKVFGPLGASVVASLAALLVGLSVRFFSVAFFPLEAAFKRIPSHLDEVSSSLGARGWDTFRLIHFELLKKPLLSAAILVFIDVIKEMPMTVMLRPFDWDTLAVQIFQFTSEGQWNEAAPAALAIVFLALLPAAYFARNQSEEEAL